MNSQFFDTAVIGDGPAGHAAARVLRSLGARTLLVDRRGVKDTSDFGPIEGLGPGAGLAILAGDVIAARATDYGAELALAAKGRAVSAAVLTVVIASGARDLPVRFPGSELPGVLPPRTALSAPAEALAGKRIVVAGAGPHAYLTAAHLVRRGHRVVALVAAGRGLAAGPGAWWSSAEVRVLRENGVDIHEEVELRAAIEGADGVLAGVDVAGLRHGAQRIGADILVPAFGVAPRLELAKELGVQTQLGPGKVERIRSDRYGRTSLRQVLAAGDAVGQGGRRLAEIEGELAGMAAGVVLYGMGADIGGKYSVAAQARRCARLRKRVDKALAQATPDFGMAVEVDAASVELGLLPTTLGALAGMAAPDPVAAATARQSNLARHYKLADREPPLAEVIFTGRRGRETSSPNDVLDARIEESVPHARR